MEDQPYIVAMLVSAIVALSSVIVVLWKALRKSDDKLDKLREDTLKSERTYKDKMMPALDKIIAVSETNNAVLNVIANQRGKD